MHVNVVLQDESAILGEIIKELKYISCGVTFQMFEEQNVHKWISCLNQSLK